MSSRDHICAPVSKDKVKILKANPQRLLAIRMCSFAVLDYIYKTHYKYIAYFEVTSHGIYSL